MAYEDFLRALITQRLATAMAPATSGGPSTGLGAPAPFTRWGDTIGSVNSAAGGPTYASDGVPPGGYQGQSQIPLSPHVPGYQPDRPHYIDGVPFPSQGTPASQARVIPNAPAARTAFPIPGSGAVVAPPGWDMPGPQRIVGGGGGSEQGGVYAIAGSANDPVRRLFELWLTSRFLPRQAM